jgi:glucose-6-phosphate isomerase
MDMVEATARTVREMKPFLMDAQAEFQRRIAYYMYRNVGLRRNLHDFSESHLKYDVTVMESGKIGREFIKTIGHYHPFKPGTATRYPEIYEVIYGHAMFIMQKIGADESGIEAVYVVPAATAGEKVVMLPGCGHVTVNIGSTPLVMANIVSDQFISIYDPYRERRGACYYILDEKGEPKPEPNKVYGPVPRPTIVKPRERFLEFSKEIPLYTAAAEDLERVGWLDSPEQFRGQLTREPVLRSVKLCEQDSRLVPRT